MIRNRSLTHPNYCFAFGKICRYHNYLVVLPTTILARTHATLAVGLLMAFISITLVCFMQAVAVYANHLLYIQNVAEIQPVAECHTFVKIDRRKCCSRK